MSNKSFQEIRNRRKSVYVTRKSTYDDDDAAALIQDDPPSAARRLSATFTQSRLDRLTISPFATARAAARIGGGRVKKTKVPFDPSQTPRRRMTICEVLPDAAMAAPAKRGRPRMSSTEKLMRTQCSKCKSTEPRKFVGCKMCAKARIHLDCLKDEATFFSAAEERQWVCHVCVSCATCYESSIIEPLLKCYSCFSHYHKSCQKASADSTYRLKIVPKDRFRCSQCESYRATARKIKNRQTTTTNGQSAKASAVASLSHNTSPHVAKKSKSVASTPSASSSIVAGQCTLSVKSKSDTSIPASGVLNSGSELHANGAHQSLEMDFAGFDAKDVLRAKYPMSHKYAMESEEEEPEELTPQSSPLLLTNGSASASASTTPSPTLPMESPAADPQPDNKGWTPFGKNDAVVPNASAWTIGEVFDYFGDKFPVVARAWVEQEVDGCVLLLMKRKDVLNMVGYEVQVDNALQKISLGMAFKIYADVLRLQVRSNDIRLGWSNCDVAQKAGIYN